MTTPPKKKANAGNAEDDGEIIAEAQSIGARISQFLKLLKPYRDLVALLVAVVVAISAVTSWITTYFATRSQVSHLECRTSDQYLRGGETAEE